MENMNRLIINDWKKVISSFDDGLFDLIYTDPPYGMSYCSNIPGDKRWKKSGESDAKFSAPIEGDVVGIDWNLFANECFRTLKNDSFLFLHCDLPTIYRNVVNFENSGFNIKGSIVWNKKSSIGGDLLGSMKRDWEPIIYMSKGKPRLNPISVMRGGKLEERKRISEISDWTFVIKKSEKCGFPTQKPLDLCRQVIRLASPIGGCVLDPFAGSGTISLASAEEKRNFVAIEIDEAVSAITRNRLEKYLS